MKTAKRVSLAAGLSLAPIVAASAAPTCRVLHRFSLSEGDEPYGLIQAPGGVLFGAFGGDFDEADPGGIFELKPPAAGQTAWSATTIYPTGKQPPFLRDATGALYVPSFPGRNETGDILKLTPPSAGQTQWTATDIYDFAANLQGPNYIVASTANTLFGLTWPSGLGNEPLGGTVFELSRANSTAPWTRTTLYSFDQQPGQPLGNNYFSLGYPAQLIVGANGVLIGLAQGGFGRRGVVFALTPPHSPQTRWTFGIAHNFGDNDGAGPFKVVADGHGTVYGLTATGNGPRGGGGIAFKMVQTTTSGPWPYNVITTFPAYQPPGEFGPIAGPALAPDGSLYGVATYPNAGWGDTFGFKLSPPAVGQVRWPETKLYDFGVPQPGFPQPCSAVPLPYNLIYGSDPDGTPALFGGAANGISGFDPGSVIELKLGP